GRGRLQEHPARAVAPDDGVRNRRPLQGDLLHVLLGHLDSLLDGHRDFLRLARAVADPALAVADDDERGEREVLAALDDLRDAVDMDDAVDQLPTLRVALLLALARRPRSAPSIAAHRFVLVKVPNILEFQAALAGRVGQGLDLAVVDVAAAVEDDLRDAL